MQEFTTPVEQLAHPTYLALPMDHIKREAGKAFDDWVEHPTIRTQLLLGGEKMVNEAHRQAVKLQTMLLAAKPKENECQNILGELSTPNRAKRPKTISMLEPW